MKNRIGCIRVHQCLNCQNWDNLPASWQWLLYLYWIWRLQPSYITLISIECHHIQMKKHDAWKSADMAWSGPDKRIEGSIPPLWHFPCFLQDAVPAFSRLETSLDIPCHNALTACGCGHRSLVGDIKPSICATSKATALPLEFGHWRYERPVPCCFSHLVKWCDAKCDSEKLEKRSCRHWRPKACSFWHSFRHLISQTEARTRWQGPGQQCSLRELRVPSYKCGVKCCKVCCNMLQLLFLVREMVGWCWMWATLSSCSCLCLSHQHIYHQSDETNLTARHRSCEPLRFTSCFCLTLKMWKKCAIIMQSSL